MHTPYVYQHCVEKTSTSLTWDGSISKVFFPKHVSHLTLTAGTWYLLLIHSLKKESCAGKQPTFWWNSDARTPPQDANTHGKWTFSLGPQSLKNILIVVMSKHSSWGASHPKFCLLPKTHILPLKNGASWLRVLLGPGGLFSDADLLVSGYPTVRWSTRFSEAESPKRCENQG